MPTIVVACAIVRPGAALNAGQTGIAPTQCVSFGSDHLIHHATFQWPLPRGLQFRMTPEGTLSMSQWYLSVTPLEGQKNDFMWIVSPPWQTAPHRIIGPYAGTAYAPTVREAMEAPRLLRFVLTPSDYAEALAVYEGAGRGNVQHIDERLTALGKGTLDIKVTDYVVRKQSDGTDTNFVEWVAFAAKACVPRE